MAHPPRRRAIPLLNRQTVRHGICARGLGVSLLGLGYAVSAARKARIISAVARLATPEAGARASKP